MLGDLGLAVDRIQEASPIVGGFLVGYVSALPLFGAASDVRGRLPVALAALVVFAAGSVVTGLAQTLPVLVGGRALQGLGGGALVPLALAAAADLYPGRERASALGWVTALQELGSVVGPAWGLVLAGILGGWRGVFLLNVPLVLLLGWALWRAGGSRAWSMPRPVGRLDAGSALALGLGLALLAWGLYPDRPEVRAVNTWWPPLLVVGAVLVVVYVRRQRATLPWTPSLVGALAANLLVGAGLIVVLIDVPIFARAVLSTDQRGAGLLLTAFLVGVPVGAVAGGWLAGRVGARFPAALGLVLAGLLFATLSGWKAGELHAGSRAYLELAVLGLGFGLAAAPLAASALADAGIFEHGAISSLVVAARTMGMVLALPALTAYGLYRVNQLVAARGAPPRNLSLHDQLKWVEDVAIAAFQQEFHEIFLLAAALAVMAAAIAGLTLSGRPEPARAGRG